MREPSPPSVHGFGRRISDARKAHELSRAALGSAVGTSGPVIGKYEREEMMPSVETAARIAEHLGLSLDYLVGRASVATRDRAMLARIEDIARLPERERDSILLTVDHFIKAAKVSAL